MATSKKAAKGKAANRDKKVGPVDRHAGKCAVCNHLEKGEIERRYMAFDSPDEIATEFEIHRDAVFRHANYYGLNRKRVENTEKVLEAIVAKGMTQLVTVDSALVMDSIRELHKVRGRHKQEGKNPDDVKRQEDDKQWAEAQLKEYMDTYKVSREQALLDMQKLAPTISECLH